MVLSHVIKKLKLAIPVYDPIGNLVLTITTHMVKLAKTSINLVQCHTMLKSLLSLQLCF